MKVGTTTNNLRRKVGKRMNIQTAHDAARKVIPPLLPPHSSYTHSKQHLHRTTRAARSQNTTQLP